MPPRGGRGSGSVRGSARGRGKRVRVVTITTSTSSDDEDYIDSDDGDGGSAPGPSKRRRAHDLNSSSSSSSTSTSTPPRASTSTSSRPVRPNTLKGANTSKANRPHPKPNYKSKRSVWNSEDDWEKIIANSSLSTASISLRRAPLTGLRPLTEYASEIAGRGFKFLWDTRVSSGDQPGDWFKGEWEYVGAHLKRRVRERVVRYWGERLTPQILGEVFSPPPEIHLDGRQLNSVAEATLFKPFRPLPPPASSGSSGPLLRLEQYTSFTLKHAPKASDVAIAGFIAILPHLTSINLKGCTNASKATVDAILRYCPRVKRLNLKGTGMGIGEVKRLLERYGQVLEVFKIDGIKFDPQRLDEVFTSPQYPHVTHLCLPGDILNGSLESSSAKRYISLISGTKPRETPLNSPIKWQSLSQVFPFLTHLYLPNLLIPPNEPLLLTPNRLKKLSLVPKEVLGSVGRSIHPFPLSSLIMILRDQPESLESLYVGPIVAYEEKGGYGPMSVEAAGKVWGQLPGCFEALKKLRDFRWISGNLDNDLICQEQSSRYGFDCVVSQLDHTKLEYLALQWPGAFAYEEPLVTGNTVGPPLDAKSPLRTLRLPSALHVRASIFLSEPHRYPRLREVDLSGTNVEDEDLFRLLDHCPGLYKVDLTSCRAVQVRNRRNIFKAWKEAREEET